MNCRLGTLRKKPKWLRSSSSLRTLVTISRLMDGDTVMPKWVAFWKSCREDCLIVVWVDAFGFFVFGWLKGCWPLCRAITKKKSFYISRYKANCGCLVRSSCFFVQRCRRISCQLIYTWHRYVAKQAIKVGQVRRRNPRRGKLANDAY